MSRQPPVEILERSHAHVHRDPMQPCPHRRSSAARGRRLFKAFEESAADIQHRWTQRLGAARMQKLLDALDAIVAAEQTRAS